jgi:hypothetical protein
MAVALLVMGIIVALCVGVAWTFYASRARRSPFRERQALTLDEIYSTFYADSALDKEAVARSLREIADKLQIPVGKLRPSDSFTDELSPNRGWEYDDGLAVLSDLARKKLAMNGSDPEAVVRIKTVDNYIRLTSQTGA